MIIYYCERCNTFFQMNNLFRINTIIKFEKGEIYIGICNKCELNIIKDTIEILNSIGVR